MAPLDEAEDEDADALADTDEFEEFRFNNDPPDSEATEQQDRAMLRRQEEFRAAAE